MKFIIERFDGKKSYEQTYTVEKKDIEALTLLSVLLLIKQTQDVTLNFTASCRCAICGACGVRVNGHAYIACDSKMTELFEEYGDTDAFRIAPLANFKVISDLVVDWEPAMENLRKIKPALVAKSEFSEKEGCRQNQEEFDRIIKQWDCILCGCCASECNKLTADHTDYMEPFVFTHAWRAANDSRSKDPMIHVKPSVTNGLWNCVHCQECANRCPKHISSADDIAGLRALAMRKGLNSGVGPAHAKSFYTDLVEDSGRLNEIRLALRTEGVSTVMRAGTAVTLMSAGKMNPLEVFGGHTIEGHKDLVKMIKAAQAANKE
ncbi:8-methylmenaquinol:fumarate reductase iron-sulfur subunit [Sulfurospirillum halorespirans]|uniref:Periplasmic methylmenaquinol:fumarate reductase, FeS cluster subunit MfrB n=1 Tax=Sulfurospirillum halorespirans DSM 13726 TaxID=1193502 RepID=A0A1D7TN92_9BACT|nr:8-methylmenaquinol:fumarate reductase iron-sulfur subunit [Sulfurospirillum halorespirans]AOO66452.1 periplasmic methylmenaquinol:fumarate reductase, FeS cluster subunit MfrB [Sulfurospirillum halorespirans DSM 13726]